MLSLMFSLMFPYTKHWVTQWVRNERSPMSWNNALSRHLSQWPVMLASIDSSLLAFPPREIRLAHLVSYSGCLLFNYRNSATAVSTWLLFNLALTIVLHGFAATSSGN